MDCWEEIHGFESPTHFLAIQRRIESAVSDGFFVLIAVEVPYASTMFDEKWYRSSAGQVWRIVSPDYPFKGVFERVKGPSRCS